jgi:hypothetical protein
MAKKRMLIGLSMRVRGAWVFMNSEGTTSRERERACNVLYMELREVSSRAHRYRYTPVQMQARLFGVLDVCVPMWESAG